MPSSRRTGFARHPFALAIPLPLHISFLLSLVLHLALYNLALWAGLNAPSPSPRWAIEATLILPDIAPPVPEIPLPDLLPPMSLLAAAPEPATAVPPALTSVPEPLPPPPATTKIVTPPPAAAPAPPPELPRQQPFYPIEAVLRGLEGEVDVAVTLDAAGNVLTARLEHGSGHALLDEAALRAARTLTALPAGGMREATLPVRFRLR